MVERLGEMRKGRRERIEKGSRERIEIESKEKDKWKWVLDGTVIITFVKKLMQHCCLHCLHDVLFADGYRRLLWQVICEQNGWLRCFQRLIQQHLWIYCHATLKSGYQIMEMTNFVGKIFI